MNISHQCNDCPMGDYRCPIAQFINDAQLLEHEFEAEERYRSFLDEQGLCLMKAEMECKDKKPTGCWGGRILVSRVMPSMRDWALSKGVARQ